MGKRREFCRSRGGGSKLRRGFGDGGRARNRVLGAGFADKGGKNVFRSSTDAASVINLVADFCHWRMMLTINMGSEFLNRQMPRNGSEHKQIVDRCDINLGSVASERTTGLPFWKRALDLALLLAVLPGLLILGVGVALVVICGSRGPVFFRQRRVGHKGREFTCYKFRTMQVNAETKSHQDHFRQLMSAEVPMTKLDARRDPRLIPLGSILRASGLDELPQLLNVVRGEMSLVGPRPCIPYEYEQYEPWQRRRFEAVPGLTGLWQVSGKNRTTFNEMIRLDIEYSERLSLWLDLKIIMKTLPAILQQCRESRALKRTEAARASAGMAKSVELYNL
jgi:lipopolysaccharide/colanic/teichoic acid biosynthesis glycosyltransferase